MPLPKTSRSYVRASVLAVGLATGAAPAFASQATRAGCDPSPVIGRDGAVLYLTVRSGCVGVTIDPSSDTAEGAQVGEGTGRAADPVAAAVVPVSGVAVDTPVLR